MSSTPRPDLDDLAVAWACGEDPPGLEERLRRDPEARRRFLDHCVAEMALVEALAGERPQVTAPAGRRRGRPRTRPVTAWWPLAAAAAVLLLAGAILWPTRPEPPTIRLVTGELAQAGRRLETGARIPLPTDHLLAGGTGAELALDPGVRIGAGPDASLALVDGGRIELASGRVRVEVDGAQVARLAVGTDELLAEVVGTVFTVERQDGLSRVQVERGRVRVSAGERRRELTAGAWICADAGGLLDRERLALALVDGTAAGERRFPAPVTVPVPAGQAFSLRLEAPPAILAFRAFLDGQPVRRIKSTRDHLELVRPFFIWGDTEGKPHLINLEPGRHQLRLQLYRDATGQALAMEPVEIVLQAEAP